MLWGRLLDITDLLLDGAHALLNECHLLADRSCLAVLQVWTHEDSSFVSDLTQLFLVDNLSLDEAALSLVIGVIVSGILR